MGVIDWKMVKGSFDKFENHRIKDQDQDQDQDQVGSVLKSFDVFESE